MAGTEQKLSMEMMKPCSVAKSSEAGDHGPAPATRFPSKRNAAAGSSYKTAVQIPIDKMLGEANLPSIVAKQGAAAGADSSASGGKVALPADEVKLILGLKRENLPTMDYLDDLAEYYTPEEIAERILLHDKDLALCNKIDDEFEAYQKEVRDSMLKKGYFEVDSGYLEDRKKINAWTKEQWASIKEVDLVFCAPGADQATQGYIEYVDSDDSMVLTDDDSD
uniref:Uncharacterized protein n=1 Tax=Hordeum vulgare subsp. vulgare TaxID=112509 RepID=A0A8I6YHZ0_HORVV